MTVAELIAELQKMSPDATVAIAHDYLEGVYVVTTALDGKAEDGTEIVTLWGDGGRYDLVEDEG